MMSCDLLAVGLWGLIRLLRVVMATYRYRERERGRERRERREGEKEGGREEEVTCMHTFLTYCDSIYTKTSQ